MDTILYYIFIPLGILMKWCWMLVDNYGLAILLFTLATKVILMPLSVWIQKNSIVMVRIQPEINFLKAKYYGDGDTIAEEEAKLFKREHYHPMLSLIPLLLQIVLLMAVIYIINHPLSYLFGAGEETVAALAAFIGANTEDSSFQLLIVDAIQKGTLSATSTVSGVDASVLSALCENVAAFDLGFLGLSLSAVPSATGGVYFLVPLFAAASSYLLCLTQNLSNVLQHEQGKLNQYGLMALSVGISLYLGFFVQTGTVLYWIASNLFAIAVMYLLNWLINPKKFVDYEALEKSRRELQAIASLDGGKKERSKEEIKREKEDYKRFFHIVNKHVVVYSEKSGFYKYFEGVIAELLKRSNLSIHYITNDPNDVIFEIAKTEPRIKPYYIGLKKLIPLMLKLECDMLLMTTPDLDKFYLKRSLMQKDIEYVYLPHDPMSVHMGLREGALDAFDTVFCTGPHVYREVRATERVYKLPEKTLVEFGFPYADTLIAAGEKVNAERAKHNDPTRRREILIAPSWNEDNLLDSCLDELIAGLYNEKNHLIVRPHPEYVKRFSAKMNAIVEKYADKVGDGLSFELDFSVNRSTYASDLLITDWSGISYEFCIATKRPALFINTKLKCLNPNWEKIDCVPVEISLRDKLGIALEKSDLDTVADAVETLFREEALYREKIEETMKDFFYNPKTSTEVGAKYLLSSLAARRKKS
ncbi:MAG: membrane protein insertase YidC [Clostridia bacterium]|nr:membrane protein insertase YidC [Clostridia bacterium]